MYYVTEREEILNRINIALIGLLVISVFLCECKVLRCVLMDLNQGENLQTWPPRSLRLPAWVTSGPPSYFESILYKDSQNYFSMFPLTEHLKLFCRMIPTRNFRLPLSVKATHHVKHCFFVLLSLAESVSCFCGFVSHFCSGMCLAHQCADGQISEALNGLRVQWIICASVLSMQKWE